MSVAESRQAPAVERSLTAEVKLHYDLHLPDSSPAPLLLALHGYGANKRQMMREALALIPAGFAVASLQGFHQHLKEPKNPAGRCVSASAGSPNFHPRIRWQFIIRRCWI